MPETVELDRKAGVIRVRSFDDVSIEMMRSTVAESLTIAKREKVKKVLVDATDLRALPGTLDLFHFAAGLPIDLKFAVVLPKPLVEKAKFAENVALNRARRFRVFGTVEDAEKWLLQRD